MAGSYLHVVDEDGALESNEVIAEMLENGGDVYEAVEEMYGMIWVLANALADAESHLEGPRLTAADYVENARTRFAQGIGLSPGAH